MELRAGMHNGFGEYARVNTMPVFGKEVHRGRLDILIAHAATHRVGGLLIRHNEQDVWSLRGHGQARVHRKKNAACTDDERHDTSVRHA